MFFPLSPIKATHCCKRKKMSDIKSYNLSEELLLPYRALLTAILFVLYCICAPRHLVLVYISIFFAIFLISFAIQYFIMMKAVKRIASAEYEKSYTHLLRDFSFVYICVTLILIFIFTQEKLEGEDLGRALLLTYRFSFFISSSSFFVAALCTDRAHKRHTNAMTRTIEK